MPVRPISLPSPISGSYTFETPLSVLVDDGLLEAKSLGSLAKAGLGHIGTLIRHFPRRHEDRRTFGGFPFDETPTPVALHGQIIDCGVKKFGWKRYAEIKIASAEEELGQSLAPPVWCRWFNMHWIAKSFAVGQEIIVYGKVKRKSGDRLVIDHPDYELIETRLGEESLHMDRVVPIYPLSGSLTQKLLRETIYKALKGLNWSEVIDLLPPQADSAQSLGRAKALQQLHFPESMELAQAARRYLALEEFFALQLNVVSRRARLMAKAGVMHQAEGKLLGQWEASLPFALTGAQQRVIAELRRDMAKPQPMNRLVQGDVGSGKTFVALAAALVAVESGSQAAIMAPTQILAEQHYLNFQKQLSPLGLRISLRTSSRKEDAPSPLPLFDSGADEDTTPHILIGTHALLHEEKAWKNLGLVVIDEQHKFGVGQRSRLAAQGQAPDVLVMTATPIPRTLALTVYGDLDVSTLDEMPANRGKIITAVRAGVDLNQVASFVQVQLAKGRQAYMVFPLVDESEKIEAKAVKTEIEAWRKRLPGVSVGLLHGKLSAEEKEAEMANFRQGDTKVLVSTTVVEVGVDVPNANLILIFNAERFGLAQLHQLRGRVGRGQHTSYCILICSEKNEEAQARLRILEETRDGFRIAEEDLKIRGPGELLGERQSGETGLQFGDFAADGPLVQRARDMATRVLANDPELTRPEHRHLHSLLNEERHLSVE